MKGQEDYWKTASLLTPTIDHLNKHLILDEYLIFLLAHQPIQIKNSIPKLARTKS